MDIIPYMEPGKFPEQVDIGKEVEIALAEGTTPAEVVRDDLEHPRTRIYRTESGLYVLEDELPGFSPPKQSDNKGKLADVLINLEHEHRGKIVRDDRGQGADNKTLIRLNEERERVILDEECMYTTNPAAALHPNNPTGYNPSIQ